jgi:hypothetical protein
MEQASRWWSWAGLIAAAAVYITAVLTLGLGLLLSPIALVVSVWAIRRVQRPRGVLVWVGLAVSCLLVLVALYVVAAIAFGESAD